MRVAARPVLAAVLVVAGLVPAASARSDRTVRPEAGTRLSVLAAGSGPLAVPFPLSHLGARWRGSEDAVVEARTAAAAGPWTAWRRLDVAHDLGDEEAGVRLSGLVRADGARRVQLRARGGDVAGLEAVVIDAVSGYRPPGRWRSSPPGSVTDARISGTGDRSWWGSEPATAPVAQPGGGAPQPDVISRAAWGADESMRRGAPAFARPVKLVVHHTVTPNDDPDPASTVRAIYAYHTRTNGWNDIGYNFLVDRQGRIYEGRRARSYHPGEAPTGEDEAGRGVVGAHARGVNRGSVGVAVLGNFSGGARPTDAAVDAVVRLLGWKAARHGIDPQGADPYPAGSSARRFPNLSGHRDVGSTSCPGDRLHERLPEIRARVAEVAGRASAPPSPAPAPPAPVPDFPGFWTVDGTGRVRAFGDAPPAGDLAGRPLAAPIVALAATPGRDGYWMAGADGGVFAFGEAPFLGSAAGALRSPAVHLEPTPSGRGYWVTSAGGEVVPFGDAVFLGATAGLPVEVAGLAATPTGRGYWLAAADGRVFGFGDAVGGGDGPGAAVAAATTAVPSATPIVSIAAHPGGSGYWLLGRDGGVFAAGAPFHGSVPARRTYDGAVQLRATPGGGGYYVAGADGAVFSFGDADRRRERPGGAGEGGVVDVAFREPPAAAARAS